MNLDFLKSLKEKSPFDFSSKPLNPFSRSIFEMDIHTSHKDQYKLLKEVLSNRELFYRLTDPNLLKGYLLLNAFRENYDFERYVTKTDIGLMLDEDYCTDEDYKDTIRQIYRSFQAWVYQPEFEKDDIKLLHGLNLDLVYTKPHDHCLLVIPFIKESGEAGSAKLIIHSPNYVESRVVY